MSTQLGSHAFRITLGARGDVLAAPLRQALASVERASLRLDNRSVTLDPAHVTVSEEFEVLDEAGRAHAQWFVLLWVPAGMILENGQAPGAITLVMTAAGGEVRTVNFAGLAAQPPSFTSIDSANVFVLASKRLGRAVTAGAALAVEVGKFASAQLKPPPEHVDQPIELAHRARRRHRGHRHLRVWLADSCESVTRAMSRMVPGNRRTRGVERKTFALPPCRRVASFQGKTRHERE